MFAWNIANRIVYQLMGRGIVDPPDDFRDSNPASNPELLEYLTDELIRSDYSVRHVSRLILRSRMFSRAAVDDVHRKGLDIEANFGGYRCENARRSAARCAQRCDGRRQSV